MHLNLEELGKPFNNFEKFHECHMFTTISGTKKGNGTSGTKRCYFKLPEETESAYKLLWNFIVLQMEFNKNLK